MTVLCHRDEFRLQFWYDVGLFVDVLYNIFVLAWVLSNENNQSLPAKLTYSACDLLKDATVTFYEWLLVECTLYVIVLKRIGIELTSCQNDKRELKYVETCGNVKISGYVKICAMKKRGSFPTWKFCDESSQYQNFSMLRTLHMEVPDPEVF